MKRRVITVENYDWDDEKNDWVKVSKTVTTEDEEFSWDSPAPQQSPPFGPYQPPYNPWWQGPIITC